MDETLKISGEHTFIFRDRETRAILRRKTYKNLVVSVGKYMIAQRLAGGSNDCNITYGAVGTDSTTPTVTDTTLGAEIERKAITSGSYADNVVTIVTFFGASEANGTLREFGLFGEDATSTPDSGTMFCRSLISETKTTSETLTVESRITIS